MTLFDQLAALRTEEINPSTTEIDLAPTRNLVELLHNEDLMVAAAVGLTLDAVARAVDMAAAAFRRGGRLIYVGAGTSGRLGILDASEMPPTYGTHPDMVQGVIAGGRDAVFRSVEGAEDSPEAGGEALSALGLTPADVVCGITASGRTPFVVGALAAARAMGCGTILVSTNPQATVERLCPNVDVYICPVVGAEPVAGSTRMKSGTAQKMVLNMITTGAMVRIGKTYGNVMVDLHLANEKLRERAKRIVMTFGGVDYDRASALLEESGGHVKTAIVMAARGCPLPEARSRLADAGGFVRSAIG